MSGWKTKDISTPVISVIMPVYNCAKFVTEAVKSILDQSFCDFELIIIDDNSTDNTHEIIETLNDDRIKFIKKKQNTGYTNSINLGLKLARGYLIARMDGDDIALPTRFQRQVDFMLANPDIAICGTWFILSSTQKVIQHPEKHDDIKLSFLSYNAIGHPTAMIRREFLLQHNLLYDSTFEPAEDYALWVKSIHLGKLANIPEPLLVYRIHENQISSTNTSLQQANSDRVKKELLFSLINFPSDNDHSNYALFNAPEPILNNKVLKHVVQWHATFITLNKKKDIFEKSGFVNFINSRNKEFLIYHLSYRKKLDIHTAFFYFSIKKDICKHFSFRRLVILTAKCFIPDFVYKLTLR